MNLDAPVTDGRRSKSSQTAGTCGEEPKLRSIRSLSAPRRGTGSRHPKQVRARSTPILNSWARAGCRLVVLSMHIGRRISSGASVYLREGQTTGTVGVGSHPVGAVQKAGGARVLRRPAGACTLLKLPVMHVDGAEMQLEDLLAGAAVFEPVRDSRVC